VKIHNLGMRYLTPEVPTRRIRRVVIRQFHIHDRAVPDRLGKRLLTPEEAADEQVAGQAVKDVLPTSQMPTSLESGSLSAQPAHACFIPAPPGESRLARPLVAAGVTVHLVSIRGVIARAALMTGLSRTAYSSRSTARGREWQRGHSPSDVVVDHG